MAHRVARSALRRFFADEDVPRTAPSAAYEPMEAAHLRRALHEAKKGFGIEIFWRETPTGEWTRWRGIVEHEAVFGGDGVASEPAWVNYLWGDRLPTSPMLVSFPQASHCLHRTKRHDQLAQAYCDQGALDFTSGERAESRH